MTNMDTIYMYTLTYKTGVINQYRGYFSGRRGCCGGLMFYDNADRRHYLTNAADKEGEVRGPTIWFRKPNLEAARRAFGKKANTKRREYFEKFLSAEERSL